jgi:uncharacterized protein YyaL (SSP411 family)
MSLYTGDEDLKQSATEYLRSAGFIIDRYPTAAGQSLALLASLDRGTRELAIVGDRSAELTRVFWARYRPHVALAAGSAGGGPVPLLEGRGPGEGALAYLCTGFACLAPTDSVEALSGMLESV